jgi:serine/threonine-protein kinase RsbT
MHPRSDETRLAVADEADLTQVVMHVGRLAQEIGFDARDKSLLMTAVSELARNILKYATKGTCVTACVQGPRGPGIEVLAVDRGPGIADLEQALQDHFSTSGTLGLGLPGVRRMMDEFEIASAPGQGTTVTIRKWLR